MPELETSAPLLEIARIFRPRILAERDPMGISTYLSREAGHRN
jgi:hypothetical protein